MISSVFEMERATGPATADPAASGLHVAADDLQTVFGSPLSSLREDWRTLFDNDPQVAVAHHPGFVEAEFASVGPEVHPALLLGCHRASELAGLAVLMPKSVSTRSAGGLRPNWRLSGFRLVGNGLIAAAEGDVRTALVEGIADQLVRRRAEFLLIEDLGEASPLMESLRALRRRGFMLDSPSGFQDRLSIHLPERAEDYWASFSKKMRSTFRRKQKKLGEHRLERVTEVAQVADFLEHAHQVSLNTWQSARLGLRVCNDAAELRFFHFLADQGLLRSYLLWQDDRPLAFMIGNQFRGRFNYEEVGFDRAYGHLSPGFVLLLKVLEDVFSSNRPDWFDFGFGDADYKRAFANYQTRSGKVWLVPPGWKNRGTVAYLRTCRTARRWGKRVLARTRWFTRLRQWIRQTPVRAAASPAADEE